MVSLSRSNQYKPIGQTRVLWAWHPEICSKALFNQWPSGKPVLMKVNYDEWPLYEDRESDLGQICGSICLCNVAKWALPDFQLKGDCLPIIIAILKQLNIKTTKNSKIMTKGIFKK